MDYLSEMDYLSDRLFVYSHLCVVCWLLVINFCFCGLLVCLNLLCKNYHLMVSLACQ